MAEDSPAIFHDCVVALVPGKELSDQVARDVTASLQDYGAHVTTWKGSSPTDLSEYTHIVAADVDFPQYDDAMDQMINVVKPSWVTQSLMKNKQVPTRPHNPDPRLIFSGINITTADIPTEDKDAIIGAVVAMGGQESSNLTKMCTHIVALSMEHEKVVGAMDKRLKCKVVLPHWFDDCLKLGKRIDEQPYTLPNPEILSKGAEEDVKVPNSQHLEGACTVRPNFLLHPTDSPTGSGRVLNVFEGRKIMLAEDLQLSSRLRAIIEDLIEDGGGSITNTINNANILVCHYRDGKDYITASRQEKDVGNLSWLYHLITNNQWTSPFRRLMHYPIPRDGIPGFQDCRITLSNYGGEARMYLENLVVASGGQFTKSMKADNTHLITARIASEKCKAAQEWGINMVNHLWIEESYANCAIQPLTTARYTHFPPRTNLGEVIGQTQFNRAALEKLYFPEDESETPEMFKKNRSVMQDKDNNASLSRPETAEANLPPVNTGRPKATPSKAAHKFSTPFSSKFTGGKENETPSSTSSRGAKDRALSRLSNLAPDIALYEKEKKRAGAGVWGGKRAADQVEKEKEKLNERDKSRKRSATPMSDEEEEEDVEEEHEPKRQKVSRPTLPAPQMRLLITSYSRWVEKAGQEEVDRRKLRAMGIMISQDAHTCTHLVAPSIIRTQKFLTALASGCILLSSSFIDTCLETGKIPPVEKFVLKDPAKEKKWNIKLKDVLARAKANNKHLLRNVVVYCTESIPNGVDTYKAIVEANGGIFAVYRGRGGTMIRPSKEGEEDETDGDPVYLLSGPREEEKRLWPKFEQMVKDGKMEPRIVSTEWILFTAMAQQLVWKDSYLMPQ